MRSLLAISLSLFYFPVVESFEGKIKPKLVLRVKGNILRSTEKIISV